MLKRNLVLLELEGEAALCAAANRMDKTIRKYTSLDEMKAEEYRYWRSRPVWERMAAVCELTQEHYAMKGAAPDVPRLQRTLVRVQRPQR